MDLSSILLAILIMLGATAICVTLFQRLGLGSVLGFIVAGILIGPYTPGPVASDHVKELQHVAELGVVLFMFVVGLEMRPEKVWSMRRLLFGLGSAQLVGTAALVGLYLYYSRDLAWETAVIGGLGLAMSSTAIIMTSLAERGEMSSEHGRVSFSILMAQDIWIVLVMALVPILAAKADVAGPPIWEQVVLVLGVLVGILVVGRYVLPVVLGYTARRRKMDAFGIILLFAVIAAAWSVEHAGISMTLGSFLLGMLLSVSDYRYQIEATVAPFKDTLMGLFFIAVGMSIDVGALLQDWQIMLVHLPVVIALKIAVVIVLALAFGVGRAAAIRSGFFLSQVGEFAFVLFGAAAVAGLLPGIQFTLAMLAVALSMIFTPLMMKLGDRLADRFGGITAVGDRMPAIDLERHVVIIGFEEVGQLICMMLEKAGIPFVAFDRDLDSVRQGEKLGRDVRFGDMYNPVTQHAAGLSKAAAAFVTSRDNSRAEGLAVTLHRLYPQLNVYVRVRSLLDQHELVAKGIKHAGTTYIESTLVRGGKLLKDLGVSEDDVSELVEAFQQDNYALIRTMLVQTERS